MAIDQTQKRIGLAQAVVLDISKLMDAVNSFNEHLTEYNQAGLTFVDSDFTTPSPSIVRGQPDRVDLTHLDAATLLDAGTKFATLLSTINSGGAASIAAAFNKCRVRI